MSSKERAPKRPRWGPEPVCSRWLADEAVYPHCHCSSDSYTRLASWSAQDLLCSHLLRAEKRPLPAELLLTDAALDGEPAHPVAFLFPFQVELWSSFQPLGGTLVLVTKGCGRRGIFPWARPALRPTYLSEFWKRAFLYEIVPVFSPSYILKELL